MLCTARRACVAQALYSGERTCLTPRTGTCVPETRPLSRSARCGGPQTCRRRSCAWHDTPAREAGEGGGRQAHTQPALPVGATLTSAPQGGHCWQARHVRHRAAATIRARPLADDASRASFTARVVARIAILRACVGPVHLPHGKAQLRAGAGVAPTPHGGASRLPEGATEGWWHPLAAILRLIALNEGSAAAVEASQRSPVWWRQGGCLSNSNTEATLVATFCSRTNAHRRTQPRTLCTHTHQTHTCTHLLCSRRCRHNIPLSCTAAAAAKPPQQPTNARPT